jgi:hypothetical protein
VAEVVEEEAGPAQEEEEHRQGAGHRQGGEPGRQHVAQEGAHAVGLAPGGAQGGAQRGERGARLPRVPGEAGPGQGQVGVGQVGRQLHRQLGVVHRVGGQPGLDGPLRLAHLAGGEGVEVLDGQLQLGVEEAGGRGPGRRLVGLAQGPPPVAPGLEHRRPGGPHRLDGPGLGGPGGRPGGACGRGVVLGRLRLGRGRPLLLGREIVLDQRGGAHLGRGRPGGQERGRQQGGDEGRTAHRGRMLARGLFG